MKLYLTLLYLRNRTLQAFMGRSYKQYLLLCTCELVQTYPRHVFLILLPYLLWVYPSRSQYTKCIHDGSCNVSTIGGGPNFGYLEVRHFELVRSL